MHTSLCNARFKLDIMRIDFKKNCLILDVSFSLFAKPN